MTMYNPELSKDHNKPKLDIEALDRASKEVARYLSEDNLTKPLTKNELPKELLESEEFLELVEREGWPEEKDDGAVDRSLHYDSVEDFWKNFTYGGGAVTMMDSSKDPNNFGKWLEAKPFIVPEGTTLGDLVMGKVEGVDSKGLDVLYGLKPALSRVYVIAKDLMEILQEYYSDLSTGLTLDERIKKLREDGEACSELKEATYTVYLLLNRLIAKDDPKRMMEKVGLDSDEEATNSFVELTK